MTILNVSRRGAIAGFGLAAASLAVPAISSSSVASRKPPRLRRGDVLGLVAPAGFIGERFGLEEIMDTVRAMGLEPRSAPHLLGRAGYLAGSARDRVNDLLAMFAHAS